MGNSADAIHMRDLIQLESQLLNIEEEEAGNLHWYIDGEYLDTFQGSNKPAKYTISGKKRNKFFSLFHQLIKPTKEICTTTYLRSIESNEIIY